MTLFIACAALLAATFAALLLPLLRRRPEATDSAPFDRAVYRAQLAELEGELVRGLIAPAEAEAARTEIARRLLATEREAAPAPSSTGIPPNRAIAAAMAAVLVLGGGGLYLQLGAPGLEPRNMGAEMRAALTVQAESAAAATQRNPADVEAWLAYARAASGLGQWSKAVEAYRKVLALRPGATPVHGVLGEALTNEAGGTVTPEARAAFLADPDSLVSRFYLAMADTQSGDPRAAIAKFQALAADLPQDAPVREVLTTRIAEAANAAGITPPTLVQGKPPTGPDEAAMAAAENLSPQERNAMARAMVERLAARLESTPDDVEGWLRLGRAYLVLGDAARSASAYDRADALRPASADIRLTELAAIIETTPNGAALPERVQKLLAEAAARAPDRPELLWYQGLVAARSGHREEALQRWQDLLSRLPPASEERRLVQSAVDALKGK